MPLRFLALSIACALALPCLVHAQAQAQAGDDATALDQIVVTATRTAVNAETSLAPIEIIDRAAIERSQARSLPDLLRGRAGISLANQGGAGKLTTLFLRGSESDHVLVLVDGVRIGSSTSGLASFQDLPIALIDRVEIVRGPRSSLYGADAIGGVIQVFTRRDRGGFTSRLSVGGGSHGLQEAASGFGGRSGRGWFGADYSFRRSEGINACRGIGAPDFAGCGTDTPDPDRDGYLSHSLSLRGGFDLSDTLSASANALRAEGENDYDGDFVDRSETVQQVVGGQLRWRPTMALDLTFNAGRNRDASDDFLHRVFSGSFASDRDNASLQGDIRLAPKQLLTLGADWLRDTARYADAFSAYTAERGNRAAFAQYQGRFGMHSLQASVRRDDNDQFGGHTTGNAAWGVDFDDAWRVTAGYGTAFKAPTFNELYYPFFGNPTLRPESSDTWELGVAWHGEHVNVRLDGYRTHVDDLISYDAARFMANNIERARLQGAELGIDATLADWTVAASASVADTENLVGFNAGKQLPRRASRSARIDLDRAFGDLRIGVTGVAEGARFDDASNSRRVGGYATLDLRAEYALTTSLTVQARLANVLDRRYETVAYYNQPGREWFLSLRYAPKD